MIDLWKLINKIEEDLQTATMLNTFQLGLALKVMEDRLWNINRDAAQKCNYLQHYILEKENTNEE